MFNRITALLIWIFFCVQCLYANAVHVDKYKLSSSDRVISWVTKSEELFLREPTSQSQISQFKTLSSDDHYENRVRTWLEIPVSGNYQFGLAGDDRGILFLSQTELPGDKERIAYFDWHTSGITNWTKYASQKSEYIYLEAGSKVYLEGWMREYGGGDYINLAWNYDEDSQLLDGTNNLFEIESAHFSGIDASRPELQINPTVPNVVFVNSTIEIDLARKDALNEIASFDIYLGENLLKNVNVGSPISVTFSQEGPVRLRVVAKNSVLEELNSTFLDMIVFGDQVGSPQGLSVKLWDGISGWKVSNLTPYLNELPSRTLHLNTFAEFLNLGDDYGSQVFTNLTIPADGDYHFFISSDDQSELYLWLDGVRTKVASNPYAVGLKNFTKYETQKSEAISLLQGDKIKVEILHKEGRGGDHLNLGWNYDLSSSSFIETPVVISNDSFNTIDPNLPEVSIITPTDKQVLKLEESIEIKASAKIYNSSIQSVQIYSGEALIAEGNVSELNFAWTPANEGVYEFTAKVIDNLGRENVSSKIKVYVQGVNSSPSTGVVLKKFSADTNENLNNFRKRLGNNELPSDRVLLTEGFQYKSSDQYEFTQTTGWLIPPKTGFYKFGLYGDDQVEVWIGKKSKYQQELFFWQDHYSPKENWNFRPSQVAQTLFLEANQKVYFQVLHYQRAGVSHFGLGWNFDSNTETWGDELTAIPLSYFETDSIFEENLGLSGINEGDILDLNSQSIISLTGFQSGVQSVAWNLNGEALLLDSTATELSLDHLSEGVQTLFVEVVMLNGFSATIEKTFYVLDKSSSLSTLPTSGVLLERWNQLNHKIIDWKLPSTWIKKYKQSEIKITKSLELSFLDGLSPTRMRTVLTAPETGTYKFWVSGDDRIRVYLSSDTSAANKNLLASLVSPTIHKDFDKMPRQKSVEVKLVEGQQYYLEVFQWNINSKQHMTLQWNYDSNYETFSELPQPISFEFLKPWNKNLPEARFETLSENRFIGSKTSERVKFELLTKSEQVAQMVLSVNSTDYTLANSSTKQEVTINLEQDQASFELTLSAVLHDGTEVALDKTTWYRESQISEIGDFEGVTRESWTNAPGDKVIHLHHFSDFPFFASATQLFDENLDRFETWERNYGERWRGYFIPPVSGSYSFWMIARDQAELWLSSDASVKNVSKVMLTTNSNGMDRWRKVDQKSGDIEFIANQKYYFEIYFKKGRKSNSYFSLGWQRPDNVMELPILNQNMRPFIENENMPSIAIEYPTAGASFKYSEPIVFHPKYHGMSIPEGSSYTLFADETTIWIGSHDHSGLVALSAPDVGELSLRLVLEHPEHGEVAAPFITVQVKSEDQDDDGLKDHEETDTYFTDKSNQDSDFDGLQDGLEVLWKGSSPSVVDITTQLIQNLDVHLPIDKNIWQSQDRGIVNSQRRGRLNYSFELPEAEKAILNIKTFEFGEQVKQAGELIVLVDGHFVNRKPLYLYKDHSLVYQLVLPYLPAGEHELGIIWNNLEEGTELCIEEISFYSIEGIDEDENGIKDWITEKVSETSDALVNEHLHLSPYPLEISTEFPEYIKVYYGEEQLTTKLASENSVWVEVPIKTPNELKIIYENGAFTETLSLAWEALDPTQLEDIELIRFQSLKFRLPESVAAASMLINGKQYQLSQGKDFVYYFKYWDTSFEVNYQSGENDEPLENIFNVDVQNKPYSYDFSVALGRDYSFLWRSLPESIVFEHEGLDFLKTWESDVCTVLMNQPGPTRAIVARRGENGPILASTSVTGYDIQISSVNSGLVNVVEEYENGTVLTEEVYTLDMFPPDFRIEIHVFVSGVTLDDGMIDRVITAEDFDETGTYRLRLIKTDALRTTLCHRIRVYQGDRLILAN